MAKMSTLDRASVGIYAMIVVSALVHAAAFFFMGFSLFNDKDILISPPPYSVSLISGEYTGDVGEGGDEGEVKDVVEENAGSTEPLATGGIEAIKAPSKVKETKDKAKSPKTGSEKMKTDEVKKETTKDLASAIEKIRKKVTEDEKIKKREANERERKSKEKHKNHDLAKAPVKGSPTGGGTKPGGGTSTGKRIPRPGSAGGGSPFGSENVYMPGGSGMGVTDAEFTAYYRDLWQRIRSMWSVPEELLEKDLETVMGIRIDRNGKIVDIWEEKSSGDEYFDETALRAVKMASPLPPLPLKYNESTMDVGIKFHSKSYD